MNECLKLVSIAIKDVATRDVARDFVEAKVRGKPRLLKNVDERLVSKRIGFFSPMKKIKLKTFSNVPVQIKTKQSLLQSKLAEV